MGCDHSQLQRLQRKLRQTAKDILQINYVQPEHKPKTKEGYTQGNTTLLKVIPILA